MKIWGNIKTPTTPEHSPQDASAWEKAEERLPFSASWLKRKQDKPCLKCISQVLHTGRYKGCFLWGWGPPMWVRQSKERQGALLAPAPLTLLPKRKGYKRAASRHLPALRHHLLQDRSELYLLLFSCSQFRCHRCCTGAHYFFSPSIIFYYCGETDIIWPLKKAQKWSSRHCLFYIKKNW